MPEVKNTTRASTALHLTASQSSFLQTNNIYILITFSVQQQRKQLKGSFVGHLLLLRLGVMNLHTQEEYICINPFSIYYGLQQFWTPRTILFMQIFIVIAPLSKKCCPCHVLKNSPKLVVLRTLKSTFGHSDPPQKWWHHSRRNQQNDEWYQKLPCG